MTDINVASELDDREEHVRFPWTVPEIGVAGVELAIAALIVGGVAAGIVLGVSLPGSGSVVAMAAQYATLWAGVVVSTLLLGAIGVCWWQRAKIGTPNADEDRARDATWRLWRVRRLALGAMAELLLSMLGSIASLVGRLGELVPGDGAQSVAGVWLPGIADIVGTVVIGLAGLWIGSSLIAQPDLGSGEGDDAGAD